MNQTVHGVGYGSGMPHVVFHEGNHDILDGIEDLDNVFGIHDEEGEEEPDQQSEKPKQNDGLKKPKRTSKKDQLPQ